MKTTEEWRVIPGETRGAEVSNLGNTRLLNARYGPRILKQWCDPDGYLHAGVRWAHGWRSVAVHRLVAFAFLGPEPEGHQVNHLNGMRADNRSSNLEYATIPENHAHARRVLGTTRKGAKNGRALLRAEDVRAIRTRYAKGGVSLAQLGSVYGVTKTTIAAIVKRRIWSWLDVA